MNISNYIDEKQLVAVSSILIALVFLYILKRIILVRLQKRAKDTHSLASNFYRVLVLALNTPLNLVIITVLIWLIQYSLGTFNLLTESHASLFSHTIDALIIVSLVSFIERCLNYGIAQYANSSPLLQNTKGIVKGAMRALLIGLALLLVLGSLGISVTPIIASLGITSLAVALALQPTLENFFSGVQIVTDKPFRIGDFIELESGEQGFVERIGWRSTWIKMLANNIIVMPNSKLSQSKIINYYYPEKELSVPVEVSVHYNSDLNKVEEVCIAVATEVLNTHPWAVATYEPFVLFHTFDNSSINLTVMLRVHEYFNRFFVKSLFIKLLHQRFNEEGIVIPFPITALNLDQEGADAIIRATPR
jgi:small-conductance mechanosensitive channel